MLLVHSVASACTPQPALRDCGCAAAGCLGTAGPHATRQAVCEAAASGAATAIRCQMARSASTAVAAAADAADATAAAAAAAKGAHAGSVRA